MGPTANGPIPAGMVVTGRVLPRGRWPLEPRPEVVRGFEPPPKPWLPGHRGVDLAGSPGQAVLSAADGTVRFAGQLAGRGVVVVSHGAIRTTYEPLLPSVRAGAAVRAGDPLGRLSGAGSHCPPRACLHWGLLRGDSYIDPLSLLAMSPVRLLPLNLPSPAAELSTTAGPTTVPTGPDVTPTGPAATPAGGDVPDAPTTGRSTSGPSAAGTAVVTLAALATTLGALMIRRH